MAKMRFKALLLASIMLYTTSDLKTAECRIFCLGEGYSNGSFNKNKCLCIDPYEYEDILLVKKKKPQGIFTNED